MICVILLFLATTAYAMDEDFHQQELMKVLHEIPQPCRTWKPDAQAVRIHSFALSPDENIIAVGGIEGSMHLIDRESGKVLAVLEANKQWFDPSGYDTYHAQKIKDEIEQDKNARRMLRTDGTEFYHHIAFLREMPTEVAFNADGSQLAVSHEADQSGVRVWRAKYGNALNELVSKKLRMKCDESNPVYTSIKKHLVPYDEAMPICIEGTNPVFSKEGSVLCTLDNGGTIRMYNTSNPQEEVPVQLDTKTPQHKIGINSDATLIAADGKTDDGTILWKVADKKQVAVMKNRYSSYERYLLESAQFTQDDRRLLTVRGNGYAQDALLWDIERSDIVREFSFNMPTSSASLSNDDSLVLEGKRCLSMEKESPLLAVVWDIRSNHVASKIWKHGAQEFSEPCGDPCFSKDDKTIFIGLSDGICEFDQRNLAWYKKLNFNDIPTASKAQLLPIITTMRNTLRNPREAFTLDDQETKFFDAYVSPQLSSAHKRMIEENNPKTMFGGMYAQ